MTEETKPEDWVERIVEGWFLCLLDDCANDTSADRLMTEVELNEHCQTTHDMDFLLAEYASQKIFFVKITCENVFEKADTENTGRWNQ